MRHEGNRSTSASAAVGDCPVADRLMQFPWLSLILVHPPVAVCGAFFGQIV